jgi:hypothetical protein
VSPPGLAQVDREAQAEEADAREEEFPGEEGQEAGNQQQDGEGGERPRAVDQDWITPFRPDLATTADIAS